MNNADFVWCFVPHGYADGAGIDDPPLALDGRRSVRETSRNLTNIPAIIVHSPLKRAVETAQLLGSVTPDFKGSLYPCEWLLPDVKILHAVDYLLEHYAGIDALFVGHNPLLNQILEHFGERHERPMDYAEQVTISMRDHIAPATRKRATG